MPKLELTLRVYHNEDGFTAQIIEMPGVVSQGDTLEEAKANVLDALHTMMEYQRKNAAAEVVDDASVCTEHMVLREA
ncbi:MAG: type II toxin-antitoxin system HicB family antitoxin [Verrucomicrobiota bacterium]